MKVDKVLKVLKDDPVNDTVHQPFSAFNQGFEAFKQGIKRDANPYSTATEKRWWDMGHWEAYSQESLGRRKS